jgi:hypothetical protein
VVDPLYGCTSGDRPTNPRWPSPGRQCLQVEFKDMCRGDPIPASYGECDLWAGYFVGILFTLVVSALHRVRESLDDVQSPSLLRNFLHSSFPLFWHPCDMIRGEAAAPA